MDNLFSRLKFRQDGFVLNVSLQYSWHLRKCAWTVRCQFFMVLHFVLGYFLLLFLNFKIQFCRSDFCVEIFPWKSNLSLGMCQLQFSASSCKRFSVIAFLKASRELRGNKGLLRGSEIGNKKEDRVIKEGSGNQRNRRNHSSPRLICESSWIFQALTRIGILFHPYCQEILMQFQDFGGGTKRGSSYATSCYKY